MPTHEATEQKALRATELWTTLKNRIVRWEYPPGYRFTEEEICKEFGVSRSPVRETLRILEEQGLVDKIPFRGCTVRQPDVQAINELYDVRAILECAVVERLATSDAVSDAIDRLAQRWTSLAQITSWSEVADVDLAQEDRVFHEILARETGNQTLVEMLSTINDRLHFMRMFDITTVERLLDTCQQHLHILEAITQHKAPQAQQAMRVNIEGAQKHVKNAIKEALAKAYLSRLEH